jgi:Mrp family chromosome partitioning ATPase
MSSVPEEFHGRTLVPFARPLRPPAPPASEHPGFLQPLLQTMIRVRTAGGSRGAFVFTAPAPGAGVSYVVQLLASALAEEERCRVLTASSRMLAGAGDRYLQHAARGYIERAPDVWALLDEGHMKHVPDCFLDRICPNFAPPDFDYVLIDCPALTEAGDALRLSPDSDGAFLVVAAERTRRDQIEHAQKMLLHSTDRLLGLVLNRRTYPVPEFLYKLL